MASYPPLAVCSTAGYQNFLALAGFPPAKGWCSTVSLLLERNGQDSAYELAQQDVQCPLDSNLCTLLAGLMATDRDFARGVCCCNIGVCIGDEPTAIITIPGTPAPTSTSASTTSQTSSSASDFLLPTSSSVSSYSLWYIQRHSSATLEPMSSVLTGSTSSSSTSSSSLSTPTSTSLSSSPVI